VELLADVDMIDTDFTTTHFHIIAYIVAAVAISLFLLAKIAIRIATHCKYYGVFFNSHNVFLGYIKRKNIR